MAFSTANPGAAGAEDMAQLKMLPNGRLGPIFSATVEATEEAIYNAVLKATTVESTRGMRHAIPIAAVRKILEKYNALNWDKTLRSRR